MLISARSMAEPLTNGRNNLPARHFALPKNPLPILMPGIAVGSKTNRNDPLALRHFPPANRTEKS